MMCQHFIIITLNEEKLRIINESLGTCNVKIY